MRHLGKVEITGSNPAQGFRLEVKVKNIQMDVNKIMPRILIIFGLVLIALTITIEIITRSNEMVIITSIYGTIFVLIGVLWSMNNVLIEIRDILRRE